MAPRVQETGGFFLNVFFTTKFSKAVVATDYRDVFEAGLAEGNNMRYTQAYLDSCLTNHKGIQLSRLQQFSLFMP